MRKAERMLKENTPCPDLGAPLADQKASELGVRLMRMACSLHFRGRLAATHEGYEDAPARSVFCLSDSD